MKYNKIKFIHILFVCIFIYTFWPALKLLVEKWSSRDEYNHAFLTLPMIIYMVWSKRKTLSEISQRFSIVGLLVVIFSLLLYVFSLLTQVHTIIFVSTFMVVVGFVIYLVGVDSVRKLFIELILFAILLPIPDQLYTQLTFPLQLAVSGWSETIVREFGVPIYREGNVMHILQKSFEVVEACSGLRYVITLLTLSVILGFFFLQSTISKLILIFASVPTAMFVNTIRVTCMILTYHYLKIDLSEENWHTAYGLIIFGLSLPILYIWLRFLEFFEGIVVCHKSANGV